MGQRVWLVTGCSSGLGELLVRQILSRGDKVVATARKIDNILHLEQQGAHILRLDVTDDEQHIRAITREAVTHYGRIDVLVNNAGYIQTGAWEDLGYPCILLLLRLGPILTTNADTTTL